MVGNLGIWFWWLYRQRGTSYSYIPKPILVRLNNPAGLKFIIRGKDIVVCRPDE